MESFLTKEQEVVVQSRITNGYELIGNGGSNINGLKTFILVKGRHRVDINTLGYDEYVRR